MDQFQCDACQKLFAHARNLNRHKQSCSANRDVNNITFQCRDCEQSFTRKDNLLRHQETFHSFEKCRDASLDDSLQFKCPICNKNYQHRKTLQRHIQIEHVSNTSAPDIKSPTSNHSASQSEYVGTCDHCKLSFSTTQSFAKHHLECGLLKRKKIEYPRECDKCKIKLDNKYKYLSHISRCGLEDDFPRKHLKKCECIVEGCTELFFHRTRMLEHIEKVHMQGSQKYEKTFDSYSDFLKWKEQVEGDTCTNYTAPCGPKKNEKCTYHYFTCQLEAPDTPHTKKGNPIRKTSRVWTKKEKIPKGHYCPARMLVKTDNHSKQVFASLIESHNHAIDYAHIKYRRVPKSVRKTIIALLTLGMTPNYIKTFLRGKVGALDQREGQIPVRKEHFVNELYIRRLKYNLKILNRFHQNDASSVDITVRNLMQTAEFQVRGEGDKSSSLFSPITVYKPQGEKVVLGDEAIDLLPNSKDLFLLGIQSREQLEMLKQGAQTVVCIDFTYKLTQYDYYLCNIIVPDEFGKGYPVAHFITNRQDKETLSLALKSIQVRCPDLNINFLMTDDDQSEWQAMEMVFGSMRRGICKYHLFRTWQRRLQSKDGVADIELRRQIFQSLTVLCHERNQPTFMKMMEAFIAKYRPLCDKFISYFVKEYATRPQVWALSYRNFPHGHTDTNMYCESFHNKIKTFYLERKQNRRVDDLLKILLEAEVDRYLEHLEMKLEGRQTSDVPVSHQRRHSKGLGISDADVSYEPGSENWVVTSQSTVDLEYYVTRHSKKCHLDHCFEMCSQPACSELCSHLYTCTCPDPSGLCKHIHKVHSLMVRLNEFKVSQKKIATSDFVGELQVPATAENDEPTQADEASPVSQEEHWKAKCLNYLDTIREKVISSNNVTMLQFLANQLKLNDGHCDAMLVGTNSHQLEKIIPVLSVSGSQKVVPYKDLGKFYRTTKKFQGSSDHLLSKPNFQERKEIKRVLVSTADLEDAKRMRNAGPSESDVLHNPPPGIDEGSEVSVGSCLSVQEQQSRKAGKSLSLKKSCGSDSRSFTPNFGFTSNIHQSVIYFDGQDGTVSSISYRAIKSIDPFLSKEECMKLNVTSLTGTMASEFRCGWLFEEVINGFFHALCKENTNCHYFNTLFSQSVAREGSIVKGALVFDKSAVDIIFIPINITNTHWTLFVCWPKLKYFEFYDPRDVSCASNYFNFYEKLCNVLKTYFDGIEKWDLKCPPHAKQTDTVSCGVFVCYYALRICQKKDVAECMKDVSNFRKRIYCTLAGNCLKGKIFSSSACVVCSLTGHTQGDVKCFRCRQPYHLACLKQRHPTMNLDELQHFCCP